MHFSDRLPLGHAGEELTRDLRQERLGEDVVYIARPALYLGAALGDGSDQSVVIGELGSSVLLQSGLDPAELQCDDVASGVIRDRVIGHSDQASEKGRLKDLEQVGT